MTPDFKKKNVLRLLYCILVPLLLLVLYTKPCISWSVATICSEYQLIDCENMWEWQSLKWRKIQIKSLIVYEYEVDIFISVHGTFLDWPLWGAQILKIGKTNNSTV
jgi:hypothetical protein